MGRKRNAVAADVISLRSASGLRIMSTSTISQRITPRKHLEPFFFFFFFHVEEIVVGQYLSFSFHPTNSNEILKKICFRISC